jgi:dTDP-4-dehydrorhamnose 3,5-epimerase
MPFTFNKTELDGILLVEPKVFGDDRGFFIEAYKKTDFEQNGINVVFVQDNHSRSKRGVLRGLHYQLPPEPQGKLVRCTEGCVFDVAVDIRKSSPTFGKWVGYELSSENMRMLWIPAGFAHGFVAVSEFAEIMYKVTSEYSPSCDSGIRWDDPEIGIKWPIDISEIVLSEKDTASPFLKDAEVFE